MRIISLGSEKNTVLTPDLVWSDGVADFALSGSDNASNPSGLLSEDALATAVSICLMTDLRVESYELRDGDENRGWPGDSFDTDNGEYQLGSKLWLLRRRALDDETILLAEIYAREALNPLLEQGAFSRFEIEVDADKASRRLDLIVVGYGRDGTKTFDDKFQVLWDQIT